MALLLAADVENKYICSRAVDPRLPPTFDLVSRVNAGVNGLRRQPFDPHLKGPVLGAGGGLLPFPAADLARVYLVWSLAAEMYDAVANKSSNIAQVRDWTALLLAANGVPLRVQLDGAGAGYVLTSVGPDGVPPVVPESPGAESPPAESPPPKVEMSPGGKPPERGPPIRGIPTGGIPPAESGNVHRWETPGKGSADSRNPPGGNLHRWERNKNYGLKMISRF